MAEQFKEIKGYRYLYEVSSEGRIWNIRTQRYVTGGKYGIVRLRDEDGEVKIHQVARLVAAAFVGDLEGKKVVFKNGDSLDRRAVNLELVEKKRGRGAVKLVVDYWLVYQVFFRYAYQYKTIAEIMEELNLSWRRINLIMDRRLGGEFEISPLLTRRAAYIKRFRRGFQGKKWELKAELDKYFKRDFYNQEQ